MVGKWEWSADERRWTTPRKGNRWRWWESLLHSKPGFGRPRRGRVVSVSGFSLHLSHSPASSKPAQTCVCENGQKDTHTIALHHLYPALWRCWACTLSLPSVNRKLCKWEYSGNYWTSRPGMPQEGAQLIIIIAVVVVRYISWHVRWNRSWDETSFSILCVCIVSSLVYVAEKWNKQQQQQPAGSRDTMKELSANANHLFCASICASSRPTGRSIEQG